MDHSLAQAALAGSAAAKTLAERRGALNTALATLIAIVASYMLLRGLVFTSA